MSFQGPRRLSSVLTSVLAAAGIVLALASCSSITPLGPTPGPRHGAVQPTPVGTLAFYKLGSPIILQVMHGQSPTTTGGCRAGRVQVSLPPGAAAMPCYRPSGTPITITSAALSPVSTYRPTPPPGQPAQPASYGFMVGVPAPQVTAVTALIKQAYDSHGALGVSVGGKLWQAAQVAQPFPGQQFQISLLSKDQALQLHDLLVPPS
jgi:hypothetical protein